MEAPAYIRARCKHMRCNKVVHPANFLTARTVGNSTVAFGTLANSRRNTRLLAVVPALQPRSSGSSNMKDSSARTSKFPPYDNFLSALTPRLEGRPRQVGLPWGSL